MASSELRDLFCSVPQRHYGHLMSGWISALTLVIKRLASEMPTELNLCMLERHSDDTSDYLGLTPVNSSVSHRGLNVLVPQ